MPAALTLELSSSEYETLDEIRRTHIKPYMRERAAALIKISEGWSGRQVALTGLHVERTPSTIYGWVHAYEEQGVDGLLIAEGRGRKPSFSPSLHPAGARRPT